MSLRDDWGGGDRQGLECASPLALWNDALAAEEGRSSLMHVPPGWKAVEGCRSL